MAFKLINARPSPFGRKVAIVLREKGLDYDVQYDVPWGEQTCTPQYSPLEQLPILITEQGEYIYDSAHIVDWLEASFPQPALLPAELGPRLAAFKRRMLGERLMEVVQNLIFEVLRPEPSAAWIDRQSRKVRGASAELERLYTDHETQTAAGLDLGDIAVATTMVGIDYGLSSGLCPDAPVLHWRDTCPNLARAVDVLDARPSFAATRPQMMDVNLAATVG